MSEPSKYAENQFDSATKDNITLMGEVLADTLPKITAAATAHASLIPARDEITSLEGAFGNLETALATAEAGQISATAAFEDKMASLTRKPDLDTNSPIEQWDSTIRSQVAYGGSIYLLLLPNGRETLTAGTYDQRLTAIQGLGERLSAQTTKPVLVTLGTTVTAFYNAANTLRSTQGTKKAAVDNARINLSDLRDLAAAALYSMVGDGMKVFRGEPLMVDTLYDVNLLRNPAQHIPAAPGLPVWAPAIRTLSAEAMPEGATRLEVWREGPGGMPELLIVGARGALSVQIPANITFDTGETYQLWFQARNAKGSSAPSPKVTWEAE